MELHSALEVAVLSNRIECVKILVAWGVSPRHSLVYAVKLGHLHILRVILEGRVDTKLLAHVHTCVKHEEWFHDNQQARECLDLLVKTANLPEGTIHFAISRDNPFVVSCLPSEPTPRMLQVAIKHGYAILEFRGCESYCFRPLPRQITGRLVHHDSIQWSHVGLEMFGIRY